MWKKEKNQNQNKDKVKKVVCLNTKEVFESIDEAARKMGLYKASISNCCKGISKSAGKFNGEKIKWMYYDDYLKLDDNQIQIILNENPSKNGGHKVICLNTKEVFESINEAGKKYNINGPDIAKCCKGISKSAGKFNGEKIKWMYYDDYLKLDDNQIDMILNDINLYTRKKIICLNTKEEFDSIKDAEKKYEISSYSISKSCEGISKSAGKINGEKCMWMYYDDYLKMKKDL